MGIQYIAGFNNAGYLPTCEPVEFDTEQEARAYLAEAMLDLAEMAEQDGSDRAEDWRELASDMQRGACQNTVSMFGHEFWIHTDTI